MQSIGKGKMAMGKKHKKKPTQWKDLAINALIDLIIGTILIIIDKLLNQVSKAGDKSAAYLKYNTNSMPSKENDIKIRNFFSNRWDY